MREVAGAGGGDGIGWSDVGMARGISRRVCQHFKEVRFSIKAVTGIRDPFFPAPQEYVQ